MATKKSFKASPALDIINPVSSIKTQQYTHEEAQENKQQDAQYDTQLDARPGYIRTQGRKGKKKPRINLAFDSSEFLDQIRLCAEAENKSITQFVNDAVAIYIKNKPV